MLKLQEFIEKNNNWEELLIAEPYYLIIKKEPINEQEDYVLFKYDQINSDFSLEVVQEARGIIFQINKITKNIKPVCIPFFKFFNLGEKYAAKLHEKSITFLEKRDGSLIKLWFNKEKWHWSTNGSIFAENAHLFDEKNEENQRKTEKNEVCNQIKLTFYDLILKSKEYNYIIKMIENNNLDKNLTYMFELTSPQAKIVVPYEGTHLTFLSARNNYTLLEQDYDFGEFQEKIPRPIKYDILSLSAAKNVVEGFSFKKEGLVAVDKNYNRVKIKSPAYLVVSYLRLNGDVTEKRIIDIIQQGEASEFLSYYPEYSKDFEIVQNKINKYKETIKAVITEEIINTAPISSGDIYRRYQDRPFERTIATAWWKNEFIDQWIKNKTTDKLQELINQNEQVKEDKKYE